MNILVIDNYDSFTYNLVYLVRALAPHSLLDVKRNDQFDLDAVKKYDKILLSPGPGIPQESGLLMPVIKEYAASKSIFGVCLGLQAIGEVFGAQLLNLPEVFHGVQTKILFTEKNNDKYDAIFDNITLPFLAGRYHSWVINHNNFPHEKLHITCQDELGYIMGAHHTEFDVQGVQFHPESILTPQGKLIILNWLKQ